MLHFNLSKNKVAIQTGVEKQEQFVKQKSEANKKIGHNRSIKMILT